MAYMRALLLVSWQVKVVEARDRIGGRVCDDTTLGTCIGRGAQIVNGCINNPMSVLCKQVRMVLKSAFYLSTTYK